MRLSIRKHNKRAQTQQVFVFILGAIIMAAVLLLGTRFIQNTLGKSGEALEINFINEMKNQVRAMESDFGSLERRTFKVGSDIEKVCFVELGWPEDDYSGLSPLITDEVLIGENNFYIIKEGIPLGDFVGEIKFRGQAIKHKCIEPTNSRLQVEFESVRQGVEIYDPNE